MLIIHGTKVSRRSWGTTHHFCPICRRICSAELIHIIRMPHIYFIPYAKFTKGELFCRSCRSYLSVPKTLRPLPADAEEFGERAMLEERMRARRLDWEQRRRLLAEPMEALQYECMAKATRTRSQSITSVAQFLTIVTGMAAVICCGLYFMETKPSARTDLIPWCIGFVAAAAASMWWMIYCLTRVHFGTAREHMVPRIAASLAQMQPQPEEIEEVLEDLRRKGNKIAKAIVTEDIWLAMERSKAT